MADYFVLFADDRNFNDIVDFLSEGAVNDLIIYGQVDREVKDALAIYNPEIINLGDRFDNNIEIVKKYLELNPTKQVVLSNGEFIETSLMEGSDPVLFIGKDNVPDQIQEFIQNSDIEIGVLVGNELIGTATLVRRQLGISVFVKFAQGARTPGGSISAVEDLDRFPMPSYALDLSVFSIYYNRATGLLEVTMRNNVEIAAYYKSTINILAGDQVIVVGDAEAIFIDGDEFKTVLYEIEPLESDDAVAELYIIYGESPKSLEFALQGRLNIESITIMDDSVVNITGLHYDPKQGAFFVRVLNVGEVDAFVDVELTNLWINGEFVTVGGDEIISLKPGKAGLIKVTIELSEEDIADRRNKEVNVRALYGQRENALIKLTKGVFEFEVKSLRSGVWTYVLILVVIILIFLILFARRRKKKEEEKQK
jgi:hypothetical protein